VIDGTAAPPFRDRSDVHVWSILVASCRDSGTARRQGERAAARLAAREILARYLGCRADEIAIERTAVGKPRLRDVEAASISFSLSHCGGCAFVAVACGRSVGVDLERIRPVGDALALAGRFFGAREASALANLDPDDLSEAFFRMWARKEAYLKGLGGAVPAGLRRFETTTDPSGDPAILSTSLEARDRSAWVLRDLAAPLGYVAALAAEGPIGRVETLAL
jgi:4'-phosphopantetheinyl transferase